MLTFRPTMDPHSVDVVRDEDPDHDHDRDRVIAMLQWHRERVPRMVALDALTAFTVDELREMMVKLQELAFGGSGHHGGSR